MGSSRQPRWLLVLPTKKRETTTSNHNCTSYSIERRYNFLLVFESIRSVLALQWSDPCQRYLWYAWTVTITDSMISIQHEWKGWTFDANKLFAFQFTVCNIKSPFLEGGLFVVLPTPPVNRLAVMILMVRCRRYWFDTLLWRWSRRSFVNEKSFSLSLLQLEPSLRWRFLRQRHRKRDGIINRLWFLDPHGSERSGNGTWTLRSRRHSKTTTKQSSLHQASSIFHTEYLFKVPLDYRKSHLVRKFAVIFSAPCEYFEVMLETSVDASFHALQHIQNLS